MYVCVRCEKLIVQFKLRIFEIGESIIFNRMCNYFTFLFLFCINFIKEFSKTVYLDIFGACKLKIFYARYLVRTYTLYPFYLSILLQEMDQCRIDIVDGEKLCVRFLQYNNIANYETLKKHF